jgi:hypothetical protein
VFIKSANFWPNLHFLGLILPSLREIFFCFLNFSFLLLMNPIGTFNYNFYGDGWFLQHWPEFLMFSFLFLLGTPQPQGLGVGGQCKSLYLKKILSFSWSLLLIVVINAKKYRIGPFLGVPEPHEVLWVVGRGWLEAEMKPLLLYGNLNFSL